MTQDEIIEMAKEAGIRFRTNVFHSGYCDGVHGDELQTFAKLVAKAAKEQEYEDLIRIIEANVAAEREACAKIFDDAKGTGRIASCREAAEAIRARGEA